MLATAPQPPLAPAWGRMGTWAVLGPRWGPFPGDPGRPGVKIGTCAKTAQPTLSGGGFLPSFRRFLHSEQQHHDPACTTSEGIGLSTDHQQQWQRQRYLCRRMSPAHCLQQQMCDMTALSRARIALGAARVSCGRRPRFEVARQTSPCRAR